MPDKESALLEQGDRLDFDVEDEECAFRWTALEAEREQELSAGAEERACALTFDECPRIESDGIAEAKVLIFRDFEPGGSENHVRLLGLGSHADSFDATAERRG